MYRGGYDAAHTLGREVPTSFCLPMKANSRMSEVPAVVVAKVDGRVVMQNAPARRLMGEAAGRDCWHVVGGLTAAEGLPCRAGCVRELLASGLEHARHTRIVLAGRQHSLTCVPLEGAVVCSLSSPPQRERKPWELLTAREREVLRLLSDGKNTTAIAAEVGLSSSTVRTHVEHMRAKLGASTRAALVARGFDLGFLC